jgi:hypothetical protein
MVLNTLKERLHDVANTKGGMWIKELPNALWGLRTQPTKPTGKSSYFLVYDSEAILPTDVMWELKDRLGDQRGGSEWEPIKILLEGD